MTDEARVSRLEKLLNLGTPPSAPLILYDPPDVPKDPAGRERYFAERRGTSETTIFIPDNGRDQEETDEAGRP